MEIALYGLHRGSSADPDTLVRRARAAEEAGIDALWVGDHVALPVDGSADPAEQPRLEAVVTLSFLAAATTRVGLGFGVLVLPQRHPVLLAKQLTSVDVLSKGRVTVGVGVGHVAQELGALGVSLGERGRRTDEYLAAMRVLWDEPVPEFQGRFLSFSGVIERPLPARRPHPPIIVGGSSAETFRRVARSANGWYGWNLDVAATGQAIGNLRAAVDKYGRPAELGEVEITITPPGLTDLDTARRYADLGVHRLVFQPDTMNGDAIEKLTAELAETLVGRL